MAERLKGAEYLAVANGILDLSTRDLLPPTPRYFNLSASEVMYEPAAICPRWERFLSEIYPDDISARDCLQEYTGYCLTDDTRQQKALALIGVKRSGKGTIARVLRKLVGSSAVCEPTLQSLGENFGLQTFIGKKVAIISDARASARNNTQAMVERILTITGEDAQHVDRKHKEPWEGRLRTRIMLLSNMLPSTQDTGAALASRFLILNHRVSFEGSEDTGLEEMLSAESGGILNWALDGLERLRARNRFLQPASGAERVREWERLNSPVAAFLQDECELDASGSIEKRALREAFIEWSGKEGHTRQVDDSHFTQELKAASGGVIGTSQPTKDGKRVHVFTGVKLGAQAIRKHAGPVR